MYDQYFDWREVAKKNTLLGGVTFSRGEVMGFVQENRLELSENGTFQLTKTMRSTLTAGPMKKLVNVSFTFKGDYERTGNQVILGSAREGYGSMDWGSISDFMDTKDGLYESKTSPGILCMYPTAFFVEHARNVPQKIRIDEEAGTYLYEESQMPELLKDAKAGAWIPLEKKEESCEEAEAKEKLEEREELEEKKKLGEKKELDEKEKPKDKEEPGLMTEHWQELNLREIFAKKGMRIGTCIRRESIEPPYEAILLSQFNSVTLESELKPSYILSQKKSKQTGKLTVAFSEVTKLLLDWCKAHKMAFRGHTLLWYMDSPEWIFRKNFAEDGAWVDREELLTRLEDMVRGYFEELETGGWLPFMYCLDVVNEAVIAPDMLRDTLWGRIIGEDYIRQAFSFARKYAPSHVKLVYNDFDLEAKTDKVIGLINSLVDEKGRKLVDAVGHQGHYGVYSNIDTLSDALTRIYKETGCELQITELDVNISRKGTQEELKRQGQFYYRFAEMITKLAEENIPVTALSLWGFADSVSWMPSNFMHIYDKKLVPKYAYFGLAGKKEYAGFAGMEKEGGRKEQQGGLQECFWVKDAPDRKINLEKDGHFTDTCMGAIQQGSYYFDGKDRITLVPEKGSYVELLLSADGNSAQRREAAGNVMELVHSLQEDRV